jgi:hypothetical protein
MISFHFRRFEFTTYTKFNLKKKIVERIPLGVIFLSQIIGFMFKDLRFNVIIGRNNDLHNIEVCSCFRDVFLFMRGYSLNIRACALFKVMLICVFQFKRVSKCKPSSIP